MVNTYLDLTSQLNTSNAAVVEVGNWDYAVIQAVSPTGTLSITATLDSGAVQGSTDGNWETSINYAAVQATRLSDGSSVTTIAATGLYRVPVVGRYLKIGGASAAATKLLVMLAKIS